MSELEKTRSHIQRMGTIMYRLCRIGIIILTIMIILQAGLTAAVLFSLEAAKFIGPRLDNNFLFDFLKSATGIDEMEGKYQAAIGCFVILVSYITFLVMLKLSSPMLERLKNGERPFDVQVAKNLRHRSYYLFLFLLYNPVLAIVSFGIVVFFSYLVEYGGYIQQRRMRQTESRKKSSCPLQKSLRTNPVRPDSISSGFRNTQRSWHSSLALIPSE